MEKYFYSKGTRKWIDVLDDLVKNYNNTKHSSIMMKPVDVINKANEGRVWKTLFGHHLGNHRLATVRFGYFTWAKKKLKQ